MVSFVKLVAGGTFAGFCGLVGFGYTNPTWTQRKFVPSHCPPFKHSVPPSREACLGQLKQHGSADNPLDVLIVGGGSVGTGVALDAVTRGLDVGLIEMNDYASGTSSKSTKLIHGGIRYLEKAVFQLDPGQLKLVAEALRERTIMIHQAPHLCHSLPTIIPCYHPYDIGLYWMGTKVYDIIAALFGGTLQYSGFVRPYDVLNIYPNLTTTDEHNSPLLGAVRYYDGQMNDARLNYSIAMTAASYGAAVVNYAQLQKMERLSDSDSNTSDIVKCEVFDKSKNETFTVYTRSIVNASGPFTSRVEEMVDEKSRRVEMIPAIGTHIVIERKFCPRTKEAMIVPSSDGRVVFAIPWQGGCLLGTTDHKCEVTEYPKPTEDDVNFLLKNIEPFTGKVPRTSVLSAWAGIRPLAAPKKSKAGSTENMSREHLITVDEPSRVLNIVGGKWTTYRRMAQDTVDQLSKTLLSDKKLKKCQTEEIVLFGARNLDAVPANPPEDSVISRDLYRHWRANYGDRLPSLLDTITSKDGKVNESLLKRISADAPVVEAEVVWAAKNEQCENVADFLTHRTRLAFVNQKAAEESVDNVAAVMARTLNWSQARISAEKANAYKVLNTFKTEI